MTPRTTPSVAYVRASPLTAFIHLTARLTRFAGVMVEYNGWLSEEAEQVGFSKPVCGFIERLQIAEARRASRIRTVTEGLKAILVENGVEAKRIAVIGNGTDVSVFHPRDRSQARARFNLAQTRPVIGFMGNLWPVVDFETLIQALVLLRHNYPKATLIVVGDGPNRALLEAARAELGDDTIRLFGSRHPGEANAILAASDVLVAPFRKARNARIGLSPLKIRDYAAMGRPVAATSLPGTDDLAGGSWAALAEPESPDALAAAMRTLLDRDPTIMSADARTYALENYSWQSIADRIGAVADEIAAPV